MSGLPRIELVLSERILQKKATGVWPEAAIRLLEKSVNLSNAQIAENRDVNAPFVQEQALNRTFPFFEYLKREGLDHFSRYYNPEVKFLTHHRCHAAAAQMMSPFEKCMIVVMDGAGSMAKDFPTQDGELKLGPSSDNSHEECTVYLQDSGKLTPIFKRWREFKKSRVFPNQTWSDGPGILYEKAAEYIFNSERAAGKVMGLAPFGKVRRIEDRLAFLESLNWADQFSGKTKKEWETSGRFSEFSDLAASVQENFEFQLFELLKSLRVKFPQYENLVFTGGCALNCTANAKVLNTALFREIYVPPFPGDESIALGAASELYLAENPWRKLAHEAQHGYFGPISSDPSSLDIQKVKAAFEGFNIQQPPQITTHVAHLLAQGEIVGWFQGRSESGPRALGNRSILASPKVKDIKGRLNREIKFREDFRPYGASCLYEKIADYFDVPSTFNSPYMSFAVRPRASHKEALKEVCHIDGSSRVQSVREGQNPLFYELIEKFGAKTGLSCVLNTSLNVMGQPIAESMKDVRNLLGSVPLHGVALGPYYIQKQ